MKNILTILFLILSANLFAQTTPNYVGKSVNGVPFDATGNVVVATGGSGGSADSLKKLPVDTSANTSGYVLAFDATLRKWYLKSDGGTTTNAVTFNNSNTGATSGTTFDGSSAVTVSANTLGALPLIGGTLSGALTFSQTLGTIITAGSHTYGATTNPLTMDLGASYSSVAGQYPKIQLYHDASLILGFGFSQYEFDYIEAAAHKHTFWSGTTRDAEILADGTGMRLPITGAYLLTASTADAAADVGISRISANEIGIGNGTVGNTTGQIVSGKHYYYTNPTMAAADSLALTDKKYVDSVYALKANINSPALTGTPTSTTPSTADNSTKIATTAYVQSNLSTALLFKYDLTTQDLNTTTTTGWYSQGNNSNATLATNYPVTNAGKLEVYNADGGVFIYQYYHSYGSYNKIYTRSYYSTWSSWKELAVVDTVPLLSFGFGSALAGDTAAASTGAIYGSTFLSGTDSLRIARMQIGLQGTSPNVTVTIYWNDSLGVTGAGAVKLKNAGTNATDIYTGTSETTFDNVTIPPGVWVWCELTAITAKPTYLSATLSGSKIHN